MRSQKDLQILQSLNLETKIAKTKARIREWHYHWGGEVFVAFSGGKDSTVLLHIVREEFPEVEAVFVDTGLEFPEIKEFVKTVENVTTIKPKMNFKEVIKKYGYPAISKENSKRVYYAKKAKEKGDEKMYIKYTEGLENSTHKLSEKFKPFLDSEIKISSRCCDVMKKTPVKKFEKETGKKAIVGTLTEESSLRKTAWIINGCNSFEGERPTSNPLSFWKEQDIWDYIHKYNIPYSKIYDMGYKRTRVYFVLTDYT
jgi:3'-phosphoadenosine 5'-phosphosulfate sulfotransferase (PAPS reductase)/FAD synthetase